MTSWRKLARRAARGPVSVLDGRWRIRELRAIKKRRTHGFSESARARVQAISEDPAMPWATRRYARSLAANWVAKPLTFPAHEAPRHFDVVIVSPLSLPGGSTGSNIQEIVAQTRAGLVTGLVHHPVWGWDVTRPIDARLQELIDGNQAVLIGHREEVSCDLVVVRAPKIGEHLMDDLPRIDAKQAAIIINQPPYYEYAADAGVGIAYDLPQVVGAINTWLPQAQWYPIGPRVRQVLNDHHRDQLADMRLSDSDWVNIIDLEAWERPSRPLHDGAVRIGRHSRDFAVKWLRDPAELLAAYPDTPEFDVRILGGAEVPRRLLGEVPSNWTVYPYNSVPVQGFLHDLDVYVYFTARDYAEAFGRAPLEAIAAGVPTIVPEEFRGLFGEAALYSTPAGVPDLVRTLAEDSVFYQAQVERGRDIVNRDFSYDAHVNRIRNLGVKLAR